MSVLSRELALPTMNIGDTMPNGGIVIDYAWDQRGFDGSVLPGGHVLALLPWSPDKYVTWGFAVHENGVVSCHAGHYFDRLQSALDDFHGRAK